MTGARHRSPSLRQNLESYMMSHELAIVIGKAMRQARHALGLTQEQVAEQLELSVEFCSRIERGVSLPSLKTFIRLAVVLQVDVNILLGFEPTHDATRQPISNASATHPRERRSR
jgi:transcriptional regulator with XRE-family HTH domain